MEWQRKVAGICRSLFLISLFGVASVDAVHACSCPPAPNTERTPWGRAEIAAGGDDPVFEGKVTAAASGVEFLGDDDEPWIRRYYSFEVSRQYRGSVPSTVTVSTGWGGGDCGVEFKIGETYLVYAYEGEDDELGTSICTRTSHIDFAGTDLRYLRDEPPMPEDLATDVSRVTRSARRKGKLCGEIRRQDNLPLRGAQIFVWRITAGSRRTQEQQEYSVKNGRYCVSGLRAGQYVVSAAELLPEQEEEGDGIPESYRRSPPVGAFGGMVAPTELSLAEGQEIHGLDISVEELPGFTVRGMIPIEGGMPESEVLVALASEHSEFTRHEQMLRLRPGSEFVFEGVPVGRYTVDVLFCEKTWLDWIAPGIQIEVGGNQEALVVRLRRKGQTWP